MASLDAVLQGTLKSGNKDLRFRRLKDQKQDFEVSAHGRHVRA